MSNYVPGQQPSPQFLAFFDVFQQALNHVEVPGMANASWDRRAAWLLLMYGNQHPDFVAYINWVLAQPKASTAK